MSKKKVTKQVKKVHRVKFIVCDLKKSQIFIEIAKIFSDNSSKSEKYTLNKNVVTKLQKANSQKEFSAIVNNEFVKVAMLDAQAKKQQLTKNTYYCASRNYLSLAVNRLQFAESAFRNRHEATAVLRKLKAKKATKKATAKKAKQATKLNSQLKKFEKAKS